MSHLSLFLKLTLHPFLDSLRCFFLSTGGEVSFVPKWVGRLIRKSWD